MWALERAGGHQGGLVGTGRVVVDAITDKIKEDFDLRVSVEQLHDVLLSDV